MTVTDLVETYLGVWNERDGMLRRAAIDKLLTEDSVYSDPDWEAVVGREAIDELVTKAQDKFGDLVFSLGRVINAHHDKVLFTWRLGAPGSPEAVATGYDVAVLRDDQVSRIDGFFD